MIDAMMESDVVVTQGSENGAETKVLETRRFGRLPSVDLRDHQFRMKLPPRGVADKKAKAWRTILPGWVPGGVLDQGYTSQCVAYSAHHWLWSHPVRNRAEIKPEAVERFYKDCQRVDEWPGEDYDGTSVRAAFKTLQALGYIGEYRWAFHTDEITHHILMRGPVVVGTLWFSGMSAPAGTATGDFIRVTGSIEGGHAYVLDAVDRVKKCPDGSKGAFRILNSWGREWGQDGRVWVSIKDFSILLAEDGEAAAATEIIKAAQTPAEAVLAAAPTVQ